MTNLLLVGFGGFIGSMARYALSGWLMQASAQSRFPVGTLVVNITGCALIGVLAALAEHVPAFNAQARLLLVTGVLGGFTTFSAFGLETVSMLRRGDAGPAAAYVLLSVLVGLLAVWLGMRTVALVR